MIVETPDAEQSTMSTTENNRRRIARMDTWIRPAETATGERDAHLRFLFYWIAYEAAYQTDLEKRDHRKQRSKLHGKLVHHCKERLQGILRAQEDDIMCILALRQTHRSFWRKRTEENGGVTTPKQWETVFRERVELAKARLNSAVCRDVKETKNKAISETLDDLFENLNVVRHQIIHGGSSGPTSRGWTQVNVGARLLEAFVPCFREGINDNIDGNWGAPPFPRVGEGRDDECPPPWLS